MYRPTVEQTPFRQRIAAFLLVIVALDLVVVASLVAVEESLQATTAAGIVAKHRSGNTGSATLKSQTGLGLAIDRDRRLAVQVAETHLTPVLGHSRSSDSGAVRGSCRRSGRHR